MRRSFPLIALACALALVAGACGKTKETGFPPPSPPPTEESPSPSPTGPVEPTGPIDVVDSAFAPAQAKVKVGTKVEWKQTGALPHTVTADDDAFDSHKDCEASKPSTCMAAGDEFSLTFDAPGEFKYYCVVHGGPGGIGMAGTIVVES